MSDPKTNRVEITLTRDQQAIVLDGHDVSRAVRSFVLSAEARRPPRLELDVPFVDALRIDLDAVVELPHHIEDVLLRLGWTPPGMVRVTPGAPAEPADTAAPVSAVCTPSTAAVPVGGTVGADELVRAIRAALDTEQDRADSIHTLDCELTMTAGFHGPCTCGVPAAVLRLVAADHALIDEVMSWKHRVVEDCWYTCPAATEEREGEDCCNEDAGNECDCGTEWRQLRILSALARGLGINPEETDAGPSPTR